MNGRLPLVLALLFCMTLALFAGCSGDDDVASPQAMQGERKKQLIAFGGGPTGGTFNFFANKMASVISTRYEWLDISPKGSGGSAENLRSLNKNVVDEGIVYAGDAFLGRNGMLPGDPTRYDKVRALSFLYGAPAQLVVRADAGIKSAYDLDGKVVAIGNPGSGAALSAERFFRHLELWDKITHRNLGYSQAAADFVAGKVDAFWVLVGYPNSSIIEASTGIEIALVDIHQDALESGFYEMYPFYSRDMIPAGTYQGQAEDVATFRDAAIWCASELLDPTSVYECLKAVFAKEGLDSLVTAHKAAKSMSVENGLEGVSIPLHPGAVKFWEEAGLSVPANLLP